MNMVEERWQKQHGYQRWCWEWNCEALLELLCVANMNKTQNRYRLLYVWLTWSSDKMPASYYLAMLNSNAESKQTNLKHHGGGRNRFMWWVGKWSMLHVPCCACLYTACSNFSSNALYLYPTLTMSSNSNTKSKSTTHNEGHNIILVYKVKQFFGQEKSSGKLKFPL
jgi:hypothetical protein